MKHRIVADDAIADVASRFSVFGEIVLLPGAAIDASVVRKADVLLVRSVTRVDDRLVEGSALRFVGTATAGTDHVDTRALARRGIVFASAPGCNASAVVHYVLTALFAVAREHGGDWLGRGPVGVVGFGHIGRRLTTVLRSMGLMVLVSDPPLQASLQAGMDPIAHETSPVFAALARTETLLPLPEVVGRSRMLSVHVPVVTAGDHATTHLVDAHVLAQLPPGSLVIHTSRGGVIDDAALESWLRAHSGMAVLEVWEGEPHVRASLLDPALPLRFATPHVAGYSLEGKRRATSALFGALARVFGCPDENARVSPAESAGRILIDLREYPGDGVDLVAEALARTYAIHEDDARMRELLSVPPAERAARFERLRRRYAFRREPTAYRVRLPAGISSDGLRAPVADVLMAIGFEVG